MLPRCWDEPYALDCAAQTRTVPLPPPHRDTEQNGRILETTTSALQGLRLGFRSRAENYFGHRGAFGPSDVFLSILPRQRVLWDAGIGTTSLLAAYDIPTVSVEGDHQAERHGRGRVSSQRQSRALTPRPPPSLLFVPFWDNPAPSLQAAKAGRPRCSASSPGRNPA